MELSPGLRSVSLAVTEFISGWPDSQELFPGSENGAQLVFFFRDDADKGWTHWTTVESDHVHHRFHGRHFITLATRAQRVEWNHTLVQQLCQFFAMTGCGQ